MVRCGHSRYRAVGAEDGRVRRAPGLLVGLLTLALTVTGCSSSGDGGDPESRPSSSAGAGASADAGEAPAIANTVNPSAELTEERLTELFAGAGISTYAEPGDAEPVVPVTDAGPVKVTGWQLSTMTRQLASGRGYLGRDLDALTADTGAGAQPVPISVVLAAWLAASETPGADVARELTGEKDWAQRRAGPDLPGRGAGAVHRGPGPRQLGGRRGGGAGRDAAGQPGGVRRGAGAAGRRLLAGERVRLGHVQGRRADAEVRGGQRGDRRPRHDLEHDRRLRGQRRADRPLRGHLDADRSRSRRSRPSSRCSATPARCSTRGRSRWTSSRAATCSPGPPPR